MKPKQGQKMSFRGLFHHGPYCPGAVLHRRSWYESERAKSQGTQAFMCAQALPP